MNRLMCVAILSVSAASAPAQTLDDVVANGFEFDPTIPADREELETAHREALLGRFGPTPPTMGMTITYVGKGRRAAVAGSRSRCCAAP